MRVFQIKTLSSGRLDRTLAEAAAEFSRTRVQAWIAAGHVQIDGQIVRDAAHRLAADTLIVLTPPEPGPSHDEAEDIPLDIIYEDAQLIVINKPAGLVTHPAPGHASGTLVNALLRHCGASLSGIGGVRRPGIVHRLDKDTSGLLVVAKTDAAHQALAAQFADHGRSGALMRDYVALAWNGFAASSGRIEAALARHPHVRERMHVVAAGRGRAAITHWQVEEALGDVALLRVRLETGRTHQIRAHMAHIGHSLLGDPVYGAGFKTKANRLDEAAREALYTLNRQALHAEVLGFAHPEDGRILHFRQPPPQDFAALLQALREKK